jgi:hypothetical protein
LSWLTYIWRIFSTWMKRSSLLKAGTKPRQSLC